MKPLLYIMFLSSCMAYNDDVLKEVKSQLQDRKKAMLLNKQELSLKEDSVSNNPKLWDDGNFVLRLTQVKSNDESLKMQIQSIQRMIDSVEKK